MAKFEKDFKSHSNTKKKDLLDSIKAAKLLYDTKKGVEEKKPKDKKLKADVKAKSQLENSSIRKESEDSLSKEDEISKSEDERPQHNNQNKLNNNNNTSVTTSNNNASTQQMKKQANNNNNSVTTSNNNNSPPKSTQTFLRRKIKRTEDKGGMDLMHKIISYLIHIAKEIEKKRFEILEEDKECLMKALEFLKDYKMAEPIDFLKVSNLYYISKIENKSREVD